MNPTIAVEVEKHEPPELPGFWMLQIDIGPSIYVTSDYVNQNEMAAYRKKWELDQKRFREIYVPSESEAAQQRRVEEARKAYLRTLEDHFVCNQEDWQDYVRLCGLVNDARAAYEAAKQAAKGGG